MAFYYLQNGVLFGLKRRFVSRLILFGKHQCRFYFVIMAFFTNFAAFLSNKFLKYETVN